MRIYLAGIPGGGWTKRERENNHVFILRETLLWSYFYIKQENEIMKVRENELKKIDLFLDSGAFSAKTQGVEIDVQEYINFIKQNINDITVYANLDVIGDPEGTWSNQIEMERAGLSPIPVYHYGEDVKWLNRYLRKGYDYIALGGMVKTPNLVEWLDSMWQKYLTKPDGLPICKVHGFGMTSLSLMLRYPWYSVDSTSWVVTGRLGSIYVPSYKAGAYNYNEQSWKISVSSQSPNIKDAGQHFKTMTKLQQEQVLRYLNDIGYEMGRSSFYSKPIDYELLENERWAESKKNVRGNLRLVECIEIPGVCNRYQLRDEVNILYFLALEKAMPEWPWAFKLQTGMTGLLL
jgi:hypothetical protein